ncbi:MAG: hypothetical protein NTV49_15855 [Kiritimatiellaeota bacterium]|nr:hypothetical protein [Kiritimatiellota bacterium]
MKKILLFLGTGLLLLACPRAPAQDRNAVTGGVRWHAAHSVFAGLPFGKGDLSYALGYEYHEGLALWQILADYAPDLTGTNNANYVITPQLNLLFEDKIWRAGLGVLDGHIASKVADESGWTGIYWQFIVGINVPIHKFSLGVSAFYPFERWGDLDRFDFRDLDYGVSLSYHF